MDTCYRCGHEMKRKDGFFCARCKEYLIKHKVYEIAVRSAISEATKDDRREE